MFYLNFRDYFYMMMLKTAICWRLWSLLILFQISEIDMIHEDERGRRSDLEIIPEVEKRRRRMRSLRRKAMNGSTRGTNSLKKRSRRVLHCHFASISTEEFLDEEEEKAVDAFRQVLIERDMLPAKHDDYHTLLRYNYLHLTFFLNQVLKIFSTVQISFSFYIFYFMMESCVESVFFMWTRKA